MVGFTRKGAERIIEATRTVERELSRTKRRVQRGAIPTESDGWGYITNHNGQGKYDWTAVRFTSTGWTADASYGSGSLANGAYAQEFNGSSRVLIGSVVYLRWTEEGYFVFDYKPDIWMAKLVSAGTISGRQGDTPGSGTVTFQKWNPSSGKLEDYGDGQVLNPFRQSIEGQGGGTLYLEVEYSQGEWWITAVDCATEDEEV